MAHFIVQNLKNGTIFVHYNGTYHSDFFEGINWYVDQYRRNTKIITIATVEQKELSKLEQEHYNKADFILVIDEDVTKTY
jgi:membrane protease subunit (stomatin/prohibitin family)